MFSNSASVEGLLFSDQPFNILKYIFADLLGVR
jgi:hypothetical protein